MKSLLNHLFKPFNQFNNFFFIRLLWRLQLSLTFHIYFVMITYLHLSTYRFLSLMSVGNRYKLHCSFLPVLLVQPMAKQYTILFLYLRYPEVVKRKWTQTRLTDPITEGFHIIMHSGHCKTILRWITYKFET